MINETTTLSETVEHISNEAANIARLLAAFKLLQGATPEVKALLHRAEHVSEEFARTLRELLASATPALRAKVDALAMPPAIAD